MKHAGVPGNSTHILLLFFAFVLGLLITRFWRDSEPNCFSERGFIFKVSVNYKANKQPLQSPVLDRHQDIFRCDVGVYFGVLWRIQWFWGCLSEPRAGISSGHRCHRNKLGMFFTLNSEAIALLAWLRAFRRAIVRFTARPRNGEKQGKRNPLSFQNKSWSRTSPKPCFMSLLSVQWYRHRIQLQAGERSVFVRSWRSRNIQAPRKT